MSAPRSSGREPGPVHCADFPVRDETGALPAPRAVRHAANFSPAPRATRFCVRAVRSQVTMAIQVAPETRHAGAAPGRPPPTLTDGSEEPVKYQPCLFLALHNSRGRLGEVIEDETLDSSVPIMMQRLFRPRASSGAHENRSNASRYTCFDVGPAVP